MRAIQYAWNQPTWPSSHSGGFSSARIGTVRPGSARLNASNVASVSARLARSAAASVVRPARRAHSPQAEGGVAMRGNLCG